MVTLKHIAEKAGVTVSVVSRALNPRPDRHARVAPDTKARIEETARSLGFRRNRSAEFLKRGKSPVIQVFLPCKACGQVANLIRGMADAAEKEDFSLSFSYGVTEDAFASFLNASVLNRTCGALAFQPFLGRTFWDQVNPEALNLKMIALNPRFTMPDSFPTLSVGFQEGGMLAAERLVSKGCASLAVIGRNPVRIAGFQSIAQTHNLPVRLFQTDQSVELVEWIRDQKKPVGLFALTDILAFKLISSLTRLGFRVPEDVCVVGHDDSDFAAHVDPPLTTIRQQYGEQGSEGIRMIVRMMYDEAVSSKVIQPVLVSRKSA